MNGYLRIPSEIIASIVHTSVAALWNIRRLSSGLLSTNHTTRSDSALESSLSDMQYLDTSSQWSLFDSCISSLSSASTPKSLEVSKHYYQAMKQEARDQHAEAG
jgi:hypothetical protein